MSLLGRITMTEAQWINLEGGTGEASWLARRTTKLALGMKTAKELLELATALKARNAVYNCSVDVLRSLPRAGYWYVCLAALASKTLGNIKEGPMAFGLKRGVKGMVEGFWEGRTYPSSDLEAFCAWINDDLDRLYPENSRDLERAIVIVAMIAGGRVLGQSQNMGGDEAVTIFKTELIGMLNELQLPVQLVDQTFRNWIDYSPDQPIADQSHIRVPGRAIFQLVPGGNRPDVVVYNDFQRTLANIFVLPTLPSRTRHGIIAVGEIKGRLDLSNAWESWMPQVVTHMRQWSDAYPEAARLFFGTLIKKEMIGKAGVGERETLRSIHSELTQMGGHNKLNAVYNLTKLAERDHGSVSQFKNLIEMICII